MQKYKVLSEDFVVNNDGGEPTVYKKGDVIEVDEARAANAVEKGWLELVVDATAPVEGAAATLPPTDTAAANGTEGDGGTVANETEAVADTSAENGVTDEQAAKTPVVADLEPRERYRGLIVLSTVDRTVGEQTFKHIACSDGTEYDLTDAEYSTEVKVAYPPQQ